MVMLMTCVFVGKETAFDFLERMAVLDRGKWHVPTYDLKPEEAEKVRGISWVGRDRPVEADRNGGFPGERK